MRKPRKLEKDAKYHVTARANGNKFILETKKVKDLFLNTVKRAKSKYQFKLTNFCIMQNHVHLMIQPLKDESLSKIMQWILATFAINFNKMFDLIGHVWYDRFHSKIMKGLNEFLETFKYIAEKPVKSKIANSKSEYKYGGLWYLVKRIYEILEPPDSSILQLFPEIRT